MLIDLGGLRQLARIYLAYTPTASPSGIEGPKIL